MTQTAVLIDSPLPNSPDTERLVLGAVFLDERVFGEVAVLDPSAFYSHNYRQGFIAMQNVAARNEPINPITVFNEAKLIFPSTTLQISEITMWSHGLPFLSTMDVYVATLKDKALKRDVIRKCGELANLAANESQLGVELAGQAVTVFQDAYSESLDKQKPTVQLAKGFESNIERWDKMLKKQIVTIETGLPEVDAQLTGGGLEKGMFHVIGARPGKGKTSLGLDIAGHNILQGKVVVFFTLELSRDVLLDRFISPFAGIDRYKITSKWMNEMDYKTLVATSEAMNALPFHINHKARTVKDMRLALKEVARETGGQIDLVVVDFLTKMHSDKKSKYEAVSDNANGLAEFAGEFNCASVALAQLNRGVTKRAVTDLSEEGRVETSDFRDSGEIEELARTILALWGSDDSSPYRNVNISCIKQGEGQTFDEKLIFNTNFMTFGVRKSLVNYQQQA
jgi:replicative DNA helicase